MAKENSRRAAAFALAAWMATKEYPSGLLPDGPDRAFVQDVVYTAVRRLRALRFILGKLVARRPKGELEALLLVGAAQILYMPDVPDFAAVSETVEAAKMSGRGASSFVNGVLRNLLRRRAELEAALAAEPLAARESFPSLLVSRWVARYGEHDAEAMCRLFNEPADTFLAWKPGSGHDAFEKLPRATRVDSVEGFAEGLFVVQDPATACAVELCGAKPGMKVLDLCAAPGGKTVQLAWRLGGEGRLVAAEVNAQRRRRLSENIARCAPKGVEVVESPSEGDLFDVVLADVPCSNTGVLRRRPDARWNWNEKKLADLAKLQGEIADRAAAFVAPGGALVYSTCSLEPEENRSQVEAFLARHPDFRMDRETESLPFRTGTDGAYACRLTRS